MITLDLTSKYYRPTDINLNIWLYCFHLFTYNLYCTTSSHKYHFPPKRSSRTHSIMGAFFMVFYHKNRCFHGFVKAQNGHCSQTVKSFCLFCGAHQTIVSLPVHWFTFMREHTEVCLGTSGGDWLHFGEQPRARLYHPAANP